MPILLVLTKDVEATNGKITTLGVELRAEMREGFAKVDQGYELIPQK
ncbi:MAG: hypothetical protein I8H75_05335 [Myxococcaceae bacterium]|nr:hypothetical protein [Myxococcaceae bacterium]MBH2006742.1 hypothetical protein [Myxococcaceae bacterium]